VSGRRGGKGAAVRTGLGLASGRYATVLDADLDYRAEAICDLLALVATGEADAAFGIRGFRAHSAYSFWYVASNQVVALAASPLFNCWITDLMTCQKLTTELYRQLAVREDGFGIQPEVAAGLVLRGARIHDVPVPYRARRREEGKKLTALDGLRVLRTLLRCRLRGG
jgi:dolichol-phosphate hexosyltransferase